MVSLRCHLFWASMNDEVGHTDRYQDGDEKVYPIDFGPWQMRWFRLAFATNAERLGFFFFHDALISKLNDLTI